MVKDDVRPSEVLTAEVGRSARGRKVHPKTAGQKRYVDAIAANTITFGIGPAGTGKSYLAVALAVQALQAKEVARIILDAARRSRPASGSGSCPATSWPRSTRTCARSTTPSTTCSSPKAPSASSSGERSRWPRSPSCAGRTLNGSFVILDEAQNTTPEQMKMFLTRIGFGTKVVVTGDVTQIDIAGGRSGLLGLEELLGEIEGIAFVRLGPGRRRAPPHRPRDRHRLRPLPPRPRTHRRTGRPPGCAAAARAADADRPRGAVRADDPCHPSAS